MRIALILLFLLSLADLGLHVDLGRRLMRAPQVAAPEPLPEHDLPPLPPDWHEGLVKTWPRRPDGTMPPR